MLCGLSSANKYAEASKFWLVLSLRVSQAIVLTNNVVQVKCKWREGESSTSPISSKRQQSLAWNEVVILIDAHMEQLLWQNRCKPCLESQCIFRINSMACTHGLQEDARFIRTLTYRFSRYVLVGERGSQRVSCFMGKGKSNSGL